MIQFAITAPDKQADLPFSCLNQSHFLIIWQRCCMQPQRSQNTDKLASTVKFLNFGTPENFALIYLKLKQRFQTLGYFVKKKKMQMEQQTVTPARSSLIWVCTVCPGLSVRKFRIITVQCKQKKRDSVGMSSPKITPSKLCTCIT